MFSFKNGFKRSRLCELIPHLSGTRFPTSISAASFRTHNRLNANQSVAMTDVRNQRNRNKNGSKQFKENVRFSGSPTSDPETIIEQHFDKYSMALRRLCYFPKVKDFLVIMTMIKSITSLTAFNKDNLSITRTSK